MGRARKKMVVFERKVLDSAEQMAKDLAQMSVKDPVQVTSFEDMGLKTGLLRGIYGYGLEKPALCQQRAILACIQGRDVICQAQSGMGKTAAFCISVLQRVDPSNRKCQALVLAPTRELAEQIYGVLQALGMYLHLKSLRAYGGTPFKENKEALEDATGLGVQIVVGTLGRVCSLMKEKSLDGDGIEILVIDEADKMIVDHTFRKDMRHIIGNISAGAQVIVMSATMPTYALGTTKSFMRKPFELLIQSEQLTLDGIQQFFVNVGSEEHKVEVLSEIFPYLNKASGIVFCNTRNRATVLNKEMRTRGHVISEMVGTMDQEVRNSRLKDFRSGRVPVLIASDVLGRGIDVHHVRVVINYDICEERYIEQYIHRVGRAGRYGKKGIAITFVTDKQLEDLARIEAYYKTSIASMPANINQLLSG